LFDFPTLSSKPKHQEGQMKYTIKPAVVNNLFDDQTYATILRFMDDWLPTVRLDSDRAEPDSPNKFGRRYGHNVGFFVNIHHQLTDYASDLFGEKVKPSYVFLSLYDKGGQCPLHIDRPQCRYTIDYLIRQEQPDPWPIAIGPQMTDKQVAKIGASHPQTPDERQAVIDAVDWTVCNLQPNDAVCYSGTNAWHYRPEPSKGTADLAFFHFVPEGFRGTLA
jgi:hypothetical protein